MGTGFLVQRGGSGSGLNFHVIGGTSAPSNPKENDIWVNTDVKITSYIFIATEPESHEEGMVWICIGSSSAMEFNALKKNGIQVYPISARQYVNGAWVAKTAQSYQGGKWVDWWDGIVFDNGNLGNSDGFFKVGSGTLTIGDVVKVAVSKNSGKTYVFANRKYNLSGYSKITFVWKNKYHWDGNSSNLGVALGVSSDGENLNASIEENKEQTLISKALDISSLQGEYYIGGWCASQANYDNWLDIHSIIVE